MPGSFGLIRIGLEDKRGECQGTYCLRSWWMFCHWWSGRRGRQWHSEPLRLEDTSALSLLCRFAQLGNGGHKYDHSRTSYSLGCLSTAFSSWCSLSLPLHKCFQSCCSLNPHATLTSLQCYTAEASLSNTLAFYLSFPLDYLFYFYSYFYCFAYYLYSQ